MPLAFQGYATFTGIQQVLSATYTLAHGISPGAATLEILPQAILSNADGTLVFTFGNTILPLPNCRVDQLSVRRNDSGLIASVSLWDRRWRWQYGDISGSYNVSLPDGSRTLDQGLKRTPQQLAALCLDAMGETGNYDISAIPNDTYPEVNWVHENPAQALQDLIEPLGCRVVLTLSGRVLVPVMGFGLKLPTDGTLQESAGSIPPARPDALQVVCGPTQYQVDFPLQPVGLDLDGQTKPINSLSYAPQVNGKPDWSQETPGVFAGVTDTPNTQGLVPRHLAQKTVWRWYQIVNQSEDSFFAAPFSALAPQPGAAAPPPLAIPGWGTKKDGQTLTRIQQVLPIDDVQQETFVGQDGLPRVKAAWVFGQWWFVGGSVNKPLGTKYFGDFSINREKGIVEFADPVYWNDAGPPAVTRPAQIMLRTSCNVRDNATWAHDRYIARLDYPDNLHGTGPRNLHRDEIARRVIGQYDPKTAKLTGIKTNESKPFYPWEPAVIPECQSYLTATDAEYQVKQPQQSVFMGLVAMGPDGAIQQVTWSVGPPAGATTTIARNAEYASPALPYRTRRAFEDLRDGRIRRLKKDAAKRIAKAARGGEKAN